MLRGIQGLFAVTVTSGERFRQYVESLQLGADFPDCKRSNWRA